MSPLIQSGEPETQRGAAIGKSGIVMDMDAVSGGFAVTVDFEDALIEIGLFRPEEPDRRWHFPIRSRGPLVRCRFLRGRSDLQK